MRCPATVGLVTVTLSVTAEALDGKLGTVRVMFAPGPSCRFDAPRPIRVSSTLRGLNGVNNPRVLSTVKPRQAVVEITALLASSAVTRHCHDPAPTMR